MNVATLVNNLALESKSRKFVLPPVVPTLKAPPMVIEAELEITSPHPGFAVALLPIEQLLLLVQYVEAPLTSMLPRPLALLAMMIVCPTMLPLVTINFPIPFRPTTTRQLPPLFVTYNPVPTAVEEAR